LTEEAPQAVEPRKSRERREGAVVVAHGLS